MANKIRNVGSMEQIELISDEHYNFNIKNEKQYINGKKYITLRQSTATELMRKGCVINGEYMIAGDEIAYKVQNTLIGLNNEQLKLIAAGKCKIIRPIDSKTTEIGYSKLGSTNILNISVQFTHYCQSIDISDTLRLVTLHKIVGDRIGLKDVIGGTYFIIKNNSSGQAVLLKHAEKIADVGFDTLKQYGIVKEDRPKDNSIEQTISRWDRSFNEGRFIVGADKMIELYIKVGSEEMKRLFE